VDRSLATRSNLVDLRFGPQVIPEQPISARNFQATIEDVKDQLLPILKDLEASPAPSVRRAVTQLQSFFDRGGQYTPTQLNDIRREVMPIIQQASRTLGEPGTRVGGLTQTLRNAATKDLEIAAGADNPYAIAHIQANDAYRRQVMVNKLKQAITSGTKSVEGEPTFTGADPMLTRLQFPSNQAQAAEAARFADMSTQAEKDLIFQALKQAAKKPEPFVAPPREAVVAAPQQIPSMQDVVAKNTSYTFGVPSRFNKVNAPGVLENLPDPNRIGPGSPTAQWVSQNVDAGTLAQFKALIEQANRIGNPAKGSMSLSETGPTIAGGEVVGLPYVAGHGVARILDKLATTEGGEALVKALMNAQTGRGPGTLALQGAAPAAYGAMTRKK
jgi:hypothetical protein